MSICNSMFANNTVIFSSGKNVGESQQYLECWDHQRSTLPPWQREKGKTESMLFSTSKNFKKQTSNNNTTHSKRQNHPRRHILIETTRQSATSFVSFQFLLSMVQSTLLYGPSTYLNLNRTNIEKVPNIDYRDVSAKSWTNVQSAVTPTNWRLWSTTIDG